MSGGDPEPTSILRNGSLGGNICPPENQPSVSNGDVQRENVRFKMNISQDINGYKIDANAFSGKGSGMNTHEMSALLKAVMGSNACGQATLTHQSNTRDDAADLFGTNL